MTPTFTLIRDQVIRSIAGENFTPGKLYYKGLFFCFTCEDEDRFLENGVTEKVNDRTAIPRGRYRLANSFSNRFQKLLPLVMDVPGFAGIRCHGGNRAEDSSGCVLLGKVRTSTGIAKCADTVQRLIRILDVLEDTGTIAHLEIK